MSSFRKICDFIDEVSASDILLVALIGIGLFWIVTERWRVSRNLETIRLRETELDSEPDVSTDESHPPSEPYKKKRR